MKITRSPKQHDDRKKIKHCQCKKERERERVRKTDARL